MVLRNVWTSAWWLAFILVTTLFGAALACWDVREYRSAYDELVAFRATGRPDVVRRNLRADSESSQRCRAMRVYNPAFKRMEYTQAGRDCLLAAMPSVRTDAFAVSYARAAASWLIAHPDDRAVRDAALRAIDAGWVAFRDLYQTYYILVQNLDNAHNKSIIMRVLWGRQSHALSYITSTQDELEKYEYQLLLPQVAKRHIERRSAFIPVFDPEG